MKIGFFGALGLIFIVLKLTELVTWSWWLVLAPLYGPYIFAFVIVLILAASGYNPKVTWNRKKD
jgi:uncharacterized paraquat-inducible protein A